MRAQLVELSHPPTLPALNVCAKLACKPASCDVDLFPQPPSPRFIDPLDCIVLCSFVLDSTLVVNEDQVVDEVGVVQLTCTIIHDECVRESEEEPAVKDDSLPCVPHLLYPNNSCDFATFGFPCENSSLHVSSSDHSLDVSL